MKLIVGLGNPGKAYIKSRHNIGFLVINSLAKLHKISLKKEPDTFSLKGVGRLGNKKAILAMPLTFMNLSGLAVLALLKKYKLGADELLVVCDDLDLEFKRFKIKSQGTSGGHRGLESIINSLGTTQFARLKIGIGRPFDCAVDASEYVLSCFTRIEKESLRQLIEKASSCCESWATKGISFTMNNFNRRSVAKINYRLKGVKNEQI